MYNIAVKQYGICAPFILSVGHLLGFRKVVELIEAFGILRRESNYRALQLVIVGEEQFPGYLKRILNAIHKNGLQNSVSLLGQIPHAHVVSLMQECMIFVFPSTCENCPTSLIEAMSLRVPVACSCFPPMPEIAGDAVLYFNPLDPFDIARCMKNLIDDTDLREELKERAYMTTRVFPSRREVAIQTFDVISEIAGSVRSDVMNHRGR